MGVWSDVYTVGGRLPPAILSGLIALVVLAPKGGGAAFNPPRIVKVVNLESRGTPETSGEARLYYIDKGQETNIISGDTLNVYREMRLSRMVAQPMRVFVGTLTIVDAHVGSALGTFNKVEATVRNCALRHKCAMKGDFVIPRLVLDSNVLFAPASANLRSANQDEFVQVADFIKFHSPTKLIVEGHTDADGDDIYNKKLSRRRAEAVKKLLVEGHDFITDEMIEARGAGEEHPRVTNDTPTNKALNRRIEVMVWWEDLEERIDSRVQEVDEEMLEELGALELEGQ